MTVDIKPAEGTQTIRGEKLVVGSDVVHVIHETERSVAQAIAIALQPTDGLTSEGPDLVHSGLSTAVEVLKVIICG